MGQKEFSCTSGNCCSTKSQEIYNEMQLQQNESFQDVLLIQSPKQPKPSQIENFILIKKQLCKQQNVNISRCNKKGPSFSMDLQQHKDKMNNYQFYSFSSQKKNEEGSSNEHSFSFNSANKSINFSDVNNSILSENFEKKTSHSQKAITTQHKQLMIKKNRDSIQKQQPKNVQDLKQSNEQISIDENIILGNYLTQSKNSRFFDELLQQIQETQSIYKQKVVLQLPNGSVYDGEILNEIRFGQGIQIFPNGTTFAGIFKNDLPNGNGILFYQNGDQYQGEFYKGKYYGFGVYKSQQEKFQFTFKGKWKDNKANGSGFLKIKYKDKKWIYKGGFALDQKSEQGEMQYRRGVAYKGNWKENQKYGYGEITLKNGIYKGMWQNNLPNGKGVFQMFEGVKIEGFWKDGKLVSLIRK